MIAIIPAPVLNYLVHTLSLYIRRPTNAELPYRAAEIHSPGVSVCLRWLILAGVTRLHGIA